MKTRLLLALILVAYIFVGSVLLSYKNVALAASDLCGGTGGNGEIVSVGGNTFTLKLNEGGI